jgi:uncharacterized protein (DUF362 family)
LGIAKGQNAFSTGEYKTSMTNENLVAVIQTPAAEYAQETPFDPEHLYPEYPYSGNNKSSGSNCAYVGVRDAFRYLKFDESNFDTKLWNPLENIIRPGDRVVLKPNLVLHENLSGDSLFSVVTHSSVVRAVLDYVVIALKGRGEVLIADAPQFDADWEVLMSRSRLELMAKEITERASVPINVIDLRTELAVMKDGIYVDRLRLAGDPRGYILIDLGKQSEFHEIEASSALLRGSDYDGEETVQSHANGSHKYLISKSVLSADVIINLPKMKVHPKAGVSLALKNIIGINGDKNLIPHYKVGGPRRGGDEHSGNGAFRDFECYLKDWFKGRVFRMGETGLFLSRKIRTVQKAFIESMGACTIRGGAWHGNDTLWRSILDLNTILFYCDKEGRLRETVQRKYICLIDGILSGERGGPYSNFCKETGCIIAARDPVAVDLAAVQFMGLNFKKLPKVRNALKRSEHTLFFASAGGMQITSNSKEWYDKLSRGEKCFGFEVSEGWKGFVEL